MSYRKSIPPSNISRSSAGKKSDFCPLQRRGPLCKGFLASEKLRNTGGVAKW
jgi:hypothetical protein